MSGAEPAVTRTFNTSCVYGPDGGRVATYRKIHLFDVDVPGAEFRESDAVSPGGEIVVASVPRRPSAEGPVAPVAMGMSICYDLRFPELFRILALDGAEVIALPAAFTATTGPPHWEILLRARAIENQVFVIAAGQCGSSSDRLRWHGHSMIIDPWGTVLATVDDDDAARAVDARPGTAGAVIVADLDAGDLARIRSVLPSLANRRPVTYRWPDAP